METQVRRKKHPRVPITCQRCGVEFRVTVSRKDQAKWCSRACQHPPQLTKCAECGIEFRCSPSDERIYCSSECSNKHASERARTHGDSRTRLYQTWTDMKNRCHCESSPSYQYYGVRGITVCNEWRDNYEAFREWAILNGYVDPLEIDRIDVNGNYEPGNCRWATRSQQMRNTRKRRNAQTSRFKGVSWCANVSKWRTQYFTNGKPVHIGLFASEASAALAYDDAVRSRFGDFTKVNFPERKLNTQGGVPF